MRIFTNKVFPKDNLDVHYYTNKSYNGAVKTLCSGWVVAEARKGLSNGWTINGIRQTTILSNITCKQCLKLSLPIFRKLNFKYLSNMEKLLGEINL